MPYICSNLCSGGTGCGDEGFWRVVQYGRSALPVLLDKLEDTTPTAATTPNFGRKYAVADIAWIAIRAIVPDLSGYDLAGIVPSKDCGECAWWKFVSGPKRNRKKLKDAVGTWLKEHEDSLVWTNKPGLVGIDCVDRCEHPAGGHFEVSRQQSARSPE